MTQNMRRFDGLPTEYAVEFLWNYFEAREKWPSRKAFLLELDNAGLSKDALAGVPELSLNAGGGDEVRPSFSALLALPAVRELLKPVPTVFRHAARVFVEQALVVRENFLPSVHFRDVQGYWNDSVQARKALQILRGPGGFFIGGNGSGTDPDDFSFSVAIDSLRYEHVETLGDILGLPRYPEARSVGADPTTTHLEVMRRIYGRSKAEQRWPSALAFAIESRDVGFVPQIVNELRYQFIRAEFSASQHHLLMLTERALPLVDPSGEDQALFVTAVRGIVELWRAREGNGDIPLAELAGSVHVPPERLGPIVAFLDSARWCHAAHRTEWTHSGLVIVPGEAELVLRNKDVASLAEYLERWEDETFRTGPQIWTGSVSELLREQREVSLRDSSADGTSSREPRRADADDALSASPCAVTDPRFRYDVAISFAGPQRPQAEELAKSIQAAGFQVFYDRFHESDLWGKNLATHFDNVFRRQARFCVPFVSTDYATRVWTTREFQSALVRAVDERGGEYLLPVLVEAVELPGLLPTIGYISLVDHSIDQVAQLLKEKLGPK